MDRHRIVIYALAFLAGVCVIQSLPILPGNIWLLALLPVLILAQLKPAWYPAACFLLGILWAGYSAYSFLQHRPDVSITGHDIQIIGVISDLPLNEAKSSRFLLLIESFKSDSYTGQKPKKVRLNWYYPTQTLLPGQRWHLSVRLKPPSGFANPGGFDYEGWLYQQGIDATGYVRKAQTNRLLSAGHALLNIDLWRYQLRQSLIETLQPQAAAIVNALVTGDRSLMTSAQWQTFINTGTSHLVAISGLHIGLVAGFAWFLIRQLGRLPAFTRFINRRLLLVSSFSLALVYAMLAGFTIPTQRALVMLAVVYLGLYFYRRVSLSQSLSLAMVLVLIISPVSVLSAGFWLSFGAVAVIGYSLSGRLKGRSRLLIAFWPQLTVVILLIPMTLYFFQQTALLALLANLVAIPSISLLILPLTLSTVLLSLVSTTLSTQLFQLIEWLITALVGWLNMLSSFHFSTWYQPQPDIIGLILALTGLLILFAPYRFPGRWAGVVMLIPLGLQASVPANGINQGDFELHVIDVGQGLSILVRTESHNLLFDTGARFSERFDVGDRVVMPLLRQLSVKQIDRLIISNGDRDHIGGAAAILRQMPVKQIIGRDIESLQHPDKQLCQRGQRWTWEGVGFEILHPSHNRYSRRNNYSCVLRVSNADKAVLISADIEHEAEAELLDNAPDKLRANVLIAPHHGSKTSSTDDFVRAVAPAAVVYSNGYLNRYHFPHKTISQRYRRYAVQQYSTAESGYIKFSLKSGQPLAQPLQYRLEKRRYWMRRLVAVP